MKWALILILSQPVTLTLHPKLYAELVYPYSFDDKMSCEVAAHGQLSAPDVLAAYCQEVKGK